MAHNLRNKITRDMGFFVAIEGIDGAGKTTQCKMLKNFFDSVVKSSVLKEPSDSKYGKMIKKLAMYDIRYFLTPETEVQWFIEDRKIDIERNIAPRLLKRQIVIMDRYYFSNIAYQGALGADVEYIRVLNEKIAPKPDVTIILDVDPKIGIQRIKEYRKEDRNIFERYEYLMKVRDIFKMISNTENLYTVNGEESIEKVFYSILKILMPPLLKKVKNEEIRLKR